MRGWSRRYLRRAVELRSRMRRSVSWLNATRGKRWQPHCISRLSSFGHNWGVLVKTQPYSGIFNFFSKVLKAWDSFHPFSARLIPKTLIYSTPECVKEEQNPSFFLWASCPPSGSCLFLLAFYWSEEIVRDVVPLVKFSWYQVTKTLGTWDIFREVKLLSQLIKLLLCPPNILKSSCKIVWGL